jgi:hypothetical protein
MTTTLVSGFLTNVNQKMDCNIDKFFELGVLLLEAKIPKIIFVDEGMYEKINTYENEYTKIILINKTDYDLYQYMNHDVLTNFSLNTDNHAKDTIEFMFTMCNKTEWLKQAINIDCFNTEQFVWVDFGIRHVFRCDDDNYLNILESLQNKNYDNGVRIGTIWDLQVLYNFNILRDITWYFAGGVFGGNKENLLNFANLTKEKCLQIISQEKTIMWEVNIWYLIYLENRDLFNTYHCGHDDTIVTNY